MWHDSIRFFCAESKFHVPEMSFHHSSVFREEGYFYFITSNIFHTAILYKFMPEARNDNISLLEKTARVSLLIEVGDSFHICCTTIIHMNVLSSTCSCVRFNSNYGGLWTSFVANAKNS